MRVTNTQLLTDGELCSIFSARSRRFPLGWRKESQSESTTTAPAAAPAHRRCSQTLEVLTMRRDRDVDRASFWQHEIQAIGRRAAWYESCTGCAHTQAPPGF
jgi:hypothetical protein